MKQIPGGVTAPKGFRAWGVHCGVKSKKADKKDLTLILSDQECAAAAVYTMNRVKAAPLYVTMEHLEDGTAWGVAANSGNANACCPMSHEYAEEMARLAARATGRAPADGMAGTPLLEWKDDGYTVFLKALRQLCQELARAIAGDGEGASRLITCAVREARSEESAERLAKAVVGSPLVKAAMFGADANWGRVLCAMGYSKAPFRPEYVDISFSSAVGAVAVCRGGMGLDFDEEAARSILSQDEVVIDVHLHEGEHEATCWGCDLTYEYVKINGDYRT